jgi:hypothetical protein
MIYKIKEGNRYCLQPMAKPLRKPSWSWVASAMNWRKPFFLVETIQLLMNKWIKNVVYTYRKILFRFLKKERNSDISFNMDEP